MAASLVLWALMGIVVSVLAYPDNVPATATVCREMTPGHGLGPQRSTAPYQITTDKSSSKSGGQIQVTIKGSDFMGFYIQARDASNSPIGTFIPVNDAKVHSCNGLKSNAAHHTSRRTKSSISLFWRAPQEYKGKVVFTATVVQDFTTYWTQIKSKPVEFTQGNNGSMSDKTTPEDNLERLLNRRQGRIMNRQKTNYRKRVPITSGDAQHQQLMHLSKSKNNSSLQTATNQHSYQIEIVKPQSTHQHNRVKNHVSPSYYFPPEELVQDFPVSSHYLTHSKNQAHTPELSTKNGVQTQTIIHTFEPTRPFNSKLNPQLAPLSLRPPTHQHLPLHNGGGIHQPLNYLSHPGVETPLDNNYRKKTQIQTTQLGTIDPIYVKRYPQPGDFAKYLGTSPARYPSPSPNHPSPESTGAEGKFVPPEPLFGFTPNHYPFPLENGPHQNPNLFHKREGITAGKLESYYHPPHPYLNNLPYRFGLQPPLSHFPEYRNLPLPQYGLLIYNPSRPGPYYLIPDRDVNNLAFTRRI